MGVSRVITLTRPTIILEETRNPEHTALGLLRRALKSSDSIPLLSLFIGLQKNNKSQNPILSIHAAVSPHFKTDRPEDLVQMFKASY